MRVKSSLALVGATVFVLGVGTAAQAVIGADEGSNSAYRFAAQIRVGAGLGQGCSGALINRQWVITAKACLAVEGAPAVTGAPAESITVAVGRTDLSTAEGVVQRVNRVVVHPDRDVALLRLAAPTVGIPTVPLASTPPTAGDTLRLLGYGRQASAPDGATAEQQQQAWVPDRLHGAKVVVSAVQASTVSVDPADAGTAAVCKGDAGGPALTNSGGNPTLAAIHHSSGQQGCYGSTGTGSTAVETRVDDLSPWITANSVIPCNTDGGVVDVAGLASPMPDFTGDCATDALGVSAAGELIAWQGSGNISADGTMFVTPKAQVGSRWSDPDVQRIVLGDFTGDGRTDLVRQGSDGNLHMWASSGVIAPNALFPVGSQVGTGWTTARTPRILTGDFNGDGITDIASNQVAGGLRVWASTGSTTSLFPGQGSYHASIGLTMAAYPRVLPADVNGDGFTDLLAQNASGDLMLFVASGDVSGVDTLFNTPPVKVGTGWSATQQPRLIVGDFTGDGLDDAGVVSVNGDLRIWASTGITKEGRLLVGTGSLSKSAFTTASYPRILTGDADADGKLDIIANGTAGNLNVWRSSGDASGPNTLFPGPARVEGTGWTVAKWPRVF